jgi:glucose-1-phosphate thymidylyltransferase
MSLAIVDATFRTIDDVADGISPSRYTMPIGNVPLISHVLGDLAAGGVSHARIVAARHERPELERALGAAGDANGLSVEVVEAPETAPRRGVLAELEAVLGAEPVVLQPGDGLCPGLLGAMRERYRSGGVDLVLSAAEPVDGRPDPGHGRLSESALVLGPRTRSLVAALLEPDGDEVNLTEVLLRGDLRLAVCDSSGGWSYESSTVALLAGNRRVLDRLPDSPIAEELEAGNELRGRISVGRDVRASGCVIHGPVAIADHAVLEDCYVGPFTAIGPRVILSGAELDDTIVLAGAEIRHPGHRITASIIGEGARVERSFELPRGVQLRLGPHSRLRFS